MLLYVQVFVSQYEAFKRQIEDMEQRLGQIVCQAFDDCSGCESALKVYMYIHNTLYSHTIPSPCYVFLSTAARDDGFITRATSGPS